MQRIKKLLTTKNKGFTLIELLVVIAIIGLLASIVVVALQGPRQTARDTKRVGDMRNIQTAMELCYGDSACNGTELYIEYATYTLAEAGGAGIGVYISATNMPNDPQSSGSYTWVDNTESTGTGNQTFCVYAELENGETAEEKVYASETGFGYMPTADTDCP